MRNRQPIRACFIAVFAFACAHSLPPEEDACVGLASAFHALASNKDLGVSFERQLQMIHEENQEDPSPETQQYLTGMLRIIYQFPQTNADELRRQVLAVCTLDRSEERRVGKGCRSRVWM